MKTVTCDLTKGLFESFDNFLVHLGFGRSRYGWSRKPFNCKIICRVCYIRSEDKRSAPQMGHIIKISDDHYGLIWDQFGFGEYYKLTLEDASKFNKYTRRYRVLRRVS